ncbi:MAG: hypothetical protein ABIO76_05040 [Ginsengibacter sp.]
MSNTNGRYNKVGAKEARVDQSDGEDVPTLLSLTTLLKTLSHDLFKKSEYGLSGYQRINAWNYKYIL